MAEIKIGTRSDLPAAGEAREYVCSGRTLCVANVDGTLSAMDNVCLHQGGPLGQGVVEDGKVVCPWHGWQFDPVSGAATHSPAARVRTFPIRVDGDDVLVQMQD